MSFKHAHHHRGPIIEEHPAAPPPPPPLQFDAGKASAVHDGVRRGKGGGRLLTGTRMATLGATRTDSVSGTPLPSVVHHEI